MPSSKTLKRAAEMNAYPITKCEVLLGKSVIDYKTFAADATRLADLLSEQGKCLEDYVGPVSPSNSRFGKTKQLSEAFRGGARQEKLRAALDCLVSMRCNLRRGENTSKTMTPSPTTKRQTQNDTRQNWLTKDAEAYKKMENEGEREQLELALVNRIKEDTDRGTPYIAIKTLVDAAHMLSNSSYTKVTTRGGRNGGTKITRTIISGYTSARVVEEIMKAIGARSSLAYIDKLLTKELKAQKGKRILMRNKEEVSFLKEYAAWIVTHKRLSSEEAGVKRAAYLDVFKTNCKPEGGNKYWKALGPAFKKASGDSDVNLFTAMLASAHSELTDEIRTEEQCELFLQQIQDKLDQEESDGEEEQIAPSTLDFNKEPRASDATSSKTTTDASESLDETDGPLNSSLLEELNQDIVDGLSQDDEDSIIDPLRVREYSHVVNESTINFIEDILLQGETVVDDPKCTLILKYLVTKLEEFSFVELAYDIETLQETLLELKGTPSDLAPYFVQRMAYREQHDTVVRKYADSNLQYHELYRSKLPSYLINGAKVIDAIRQKNIDLVLENYKTFTHCNPSDGKEKQLFRATKMFFNSTINTVYSSAINNFQNHENYHMIARLFNVMDPRTVQCCRNMWALEKAREAAEA